MCTCLPSELILNADFSVYHLHLHPEDIADIIFFVGDPNRVEEVSQHFDSVELRKSHREFTTHTGFIGSLRLSVISTGIGVDNIDIVFNELDLLSKVNLKSRILLSRPRKLKIIRLGTTGSLSKQINLDDILFSRYAIGIDGIPYHYHSSSQVFEPELGQKFSQITDWPKQLAEPYAVKSSDILWDLLYETKYKQGITLTMNGFYGPQGRSIILPLKNPDLLNKSSSLIYNSLYVSNLEMETAGIYAFGKLLNHEVISISVVLADRISGRFSKTPILTIAKMIRLALAKIEVLQNK
jgi:uridine phosphorylase